MKISVLQAAILVLCPGSLLFTAPSAACQSSGGATPAIVTSAQGSAYVPMDSWLYQALDRLHGLGYLNDAYMGIKPWTRLSIAHMLNESADGLQASSDEEARDLFLAIRKEIQPEVDNPTSLLQPDGIFESAYTRVLGISGTPLNDSFHFGETIVNDYGRPYQEGFNNDSGFSVRANAGRFTVYYRGEFQHAPGAAGYSPTLAAYLSNVTDGIDYTLDPHQDTIPAGPIAATNRVRLLEGYVSYELLNHEVSFGKQDHWMGPDQGASMLWSNNAENIYNFHIDRIEPLNIPLISKLTGPFRYDFYVGSLKGHTYPNSPWVHVEKVSFKPSRDLEFGFSRMVIWGGKGHVPITLHTFLKSFFSFQNVPPSEKLSRSDPGARFGTFDFTWRLPYLQHWITLYTDSLVHDDVSPIDAPRRASFHPGIYLSRVPGLQHLDLRFEGATTDAGQVGSREVNGQFFYWETVQRQGPTNNGKLLGDWIGRMSKGGQAWATWHLSPKDQVGVSYRRAKASPQFLPGGTTQNDYTVSATKWVARDFEIQGSLQYERWKAPLYLPGAQSNTSVTAGVTWYPPRRTP